MQSKPQLNVTANSVYYKDSNWLKINEETDLGAQEVDRTVLVQVAFHKAH